jgi:DUF1680 family protein
MRGPILYCLEEVDNGKNLFDICLDSKGQMNIVHDKELSVPVIYTQGTRRSLKGWPGDLYRPVSSSKANTKVKAVPYYFWANRGPGEMLVWIRDRHA